MIKYLRTNSDDKGFQILVKDLDKYLSITDGDEHAFYAQFNKLDLIKYVIVAYDDDQPIACGAIKELSPDTMEIKRMFVSRSHRNKNIASGILKMLEAWAAEMNYHKCVLETGNKQPEAIRLYLKNGYTIIPNYGQYENVENSVCFEKKL